MLDREISRKKFIIGVGATVASVALAKSTIGTVLAGGSAESSDNAKAPEWPFPYKKVDPDKAAQMGYKGYQEKGG